jgi:hypothetical protein
MRQARGLEFHLFILKRMVLNLGPLFGTIEFAAIAAVVLFKPSNKYFLATYDSEPNDQNVALERNA